MRHSFHVCNVSNLTCYSATKLARLAKPARISTFLAHSIDQADDAALQTVMLKQSSVVASKENKALLLPLHHHPLMPLKLSLPFLLLRFHPLKASPHSMLWIAFFRTSLPTFTQSRRSHTRRPSCNPSTDETMFTTSSSLL